MKRILFKTTIPRAEDDWHVGHFSLLAQQLESLRDDRGDPSFSVTARDRTTDADGDDPDLVNLPDSHFDELWLFAVDVGAGLTTADADRDSPLHRARRGCCSLAIIMTSARVCSSSAKLVMPISSTA